MAGDEYVELPVELIQHIQSYLYQKEAARASVLSKLWYSAWSTRPVLCLDESSFPRTVTFTEFKNLARARIERYQKLNVKLNTFKLSLSWCFHDADDESIRFLDESILSALTLGVDDLDLRFSRYCKYTLPDQVFSSICLKKLYIHGGIINLPQSNGKSSLLCSRLVSLRLSCVDLSDDMMRDILLGCPLMEDLWVSECCGLTKINLGVMRRNLKTFHAHNGMENCLVEWVENNVPGLQQQFHNLISLELECVEVDDLFFKCFSHRFPCLERLELEECIGPVTNIDFASNSLRYLSLTTIHGMIFANDQVSNARHQYHNLISLKLSDVEVDDLLFKFFSHRFPCLERLELLYCSGPVINIDIASNSLRYLTLLKFDKLSVIKVQAPNIQNFRLITTTRTEGNPSVSFLTVASKEWKSYLEFYQCPSVSDVSWLSKISDTLRELSSSKISIVLDLESGHLGSISAGDIPSRPTSPFVENLQIQTKLKCRKSWCYGYLFGWLLCCRPKCITWMGEYLRNCYETTELVYNELKKNENKIASFYQLPCIHGLEEVDMEHYDNTLREWRQVRHGDKEVAAHGGMFRLKLKRFYAS